MINDLLDKLEAKGIKFYAFADDLGNLLKGKNKLNVAIRIIMEWASNNEMIINKKKSAIMRFQKKGL